MKKILIAGGSGFIGQALVKELAQSYAITVLGRDMTKLDRCFAPPIDKLLWSNLSKADAQQFTAIINLCGASIGEKRWSAEVKQTLIHSRTETNQTLINWLIKANAKPHYLCANAVGIYGLQANDDQTAFNEQTAIDPEHPTDFLSKIGLVWQQSLLPAIDHGIAVTTLRFGVVLQRNQGMLKKLQVPFSLGLGCILGDGQQMISWIHIDDVTAAISFLLERSDIISAVNLTTPNPVNQREFAKTLAYVLHRPLFLRLPASFIKLLFGEMGECLLLKGQRVLPSRLQQRRFQFKYPTLLAALNHEYN